MSAAPYLGTGSWLPTFPKPMGTSPSRWVGAARGRTSPIIPFVPAEYSRHHSPVTRVSSSTRVGWGVAGYCWREGVADGMVYSRQLGHSDSRKLERSYRFWNEALELGSCIPSCWRALMFMKVVTTIWACGICCTNPALVYFVF